MYLVSLKSTHHAMMLEHICKTQQLASITIPTPRAISKSCGMSVKFQEDIELAKLISILEENNLQVVGVFIVGENSLERVYTNMED